MVRIITKSESAKLTDSAIVVYMQHINTPSGKVCVPKKPRKNAKNVLTKNEVSELNDMVYLGILNKKITDKGVEYSRGDVFILQEIMNRKTNAQK